MQQEEIEKIHFLVKEIEKNTQPIVDSDKTKVIIYGKYNCGKSSLLDALVQNELKIENNNRKVLLDGRGVYHTECIHYRQSVEIDNESNLIFCEFPIIFYNGHWSVNNILNSYLIHKMLIEKKNKIKIILVSTPYEIVGFRGIGFQNLVEELERIFPKIESLMKNAALVISKIRKNDDNALIHSIIEAIGELSVCYPDFSDEVYISESNKWYHYLLENMNQVFLFSEPSSNDVGKMYQFEKREELIDFLKKDPLVNPEINYISCEESLKTANLLETMHSNSISNVIHELFKKINKNIHKEHNQDEKNKLINSMNIIISTKFNSYEEISQILSEKIQNHQEYDIYYQQISEFHEFYSFLNKYVSNEKFELKVSRELQSLASQTLIELQKITNSN